MDTDTHTTATPATSVAPKAQLARMVTNGALYQSANEALKAVQDDYLYWTEKLTDTSLQLSYAVIAANWAVFGSVDKLLSNFWSRLSMGLVVSALLLSVFSAKYMSELHRKQVNHAESDLGRWDAEFEENVGKREPWPFTTRIERLGRVTRELKAWLPLLAGMAFLIALLYR